MDTFDTLDDTQLALLLSLIAHQHCLLTTDRPALPSLITSISDFLTRSFSLEVASVSCDADTTLDEFAAGIIKDGSEGPRLANVLLLKDLDRAGEQVQAQVLELMGGKGVRLMTRKVGIAAPGRFLIVGVMERGAGRGLLPELLDHFFISHYYDSFPYENRSYTTTGSDHDPDQDPDPETASLASVVRKAPSVAPSVAPELTFSDELLDQLSNQAQRAFFHIEVKKYMLDIVTFLRLHRATARGVTPLATRHFELLVRCLAPLHNMTFVTPTLAQLAAPKVYTHRIEVCTTEEERSMMWGSSGEAVEAWLRGATAETVVDDVLDMVKAPV